ncbi:MAG: hypothetical protein R3E01_11550 [Pirellulaceae bacterium]
MFFETPLALVAYVELAATAISIFAGTYFALLCAMEMTRSWRRR